MHGLQNLVDNFWHQISLILGREQQLSRAFPTMKSKGKYEVYGIVTNMDWDGEERIGPFTARFLREDRPLDNDLLVGQSTFYATI